MKVQFLNDDGELVEGALMINGVLIDEEALRRSPFFRAVAAAEWDLIKRYDRGELRAQGEQESGSK